MLKNWHTISSDFVYDAGIFKVRRDCCRSSNDNKEFNFHIISSEDWVQVIPILRSTGKKDHIILVKQFRHGTREFYLEIPGGICNKDEDYAESARRELLEETGYIAQHIEHLADFYPNPSIQDNKSHVYVAIVDPLPQSQSLDPTEDIEVVIKDLDEVLDNPMSHGLLNAIVLTGLLLYGKTLCDKKNKTNPTKD